MDFIKTIVVIYFFLLFNSCTQRIDLNLNSSEAQIMIEALVSTNAESIVTISHSVNFDERNIFPPVSNAIVELSDNKGNNVLLSEKKPGQYISSSHIGTEGNSYKLKVINGNETYTSTCQIPKFISLDSINIKKELDNGFLGNKSDSIIKLRVYFKDLAKISNYYQFLEYRNNIKVKSYVFDDKYQDGIEIEKILSFKDRQLEHGDTLRVEMRCISAEVFEYLNDLYNHSGKMSATPTNPETNIENAEIGYFSAHTSEMKSIIY